MKMDTDRDTEVDISEGEIPDHVTVTLNRHAAVYLMGCARADATSYDDVANPPRDALDALRAALSPEGGE